MAKSHLELFKELNKLHSSFVMTLYNNFECSYLQKIILTFSDLNLGSKSFKI